MKQTRTYFNKSFYKTHEPTRTVCFSGHFLSSQGLSLTVVGESSPRNLLRTRIREGMNLHLGVGAPGLIPALQGLEKPEFPILPSGPIPFPS